MTDAPADFFDGSEGVAKVMTFKPVGPVAANFRDDKRFITSIMGPYGSGKTSTCFQKIINTALWQRPDKNGVRHSRGMVLRSTYGQLQSNVMEDWFSWFPKTKDNWNGERMDHDLHIDLMLPGNRVVPIHLQVLFRACEDEKKAEALLKGINLTWGWLNEVDTLNPAIIRFLAPRLGRYPGTKEGGCVWSGMFCDMNAPDIDNWTYDLLVNGNMGISDEQIEVFRQAYGNLFGVGFHRQPGGLEAGAENIDNLPVGYYERLCMSLSENDKRRFVDNQFGAVRAGQPVYPDFNDRFHVASGRLSPLPDVPAILAIDGGSTPAAVLLQRSDTGQIRVIDEIVVFSNDLQKPLEQVGAIAFAKLCRRVLDERYPRLRLSAVVGDPAMLHGEHGEDKSWGTNFGTAFGMKVKAAPTRGNRLSERLEAVRRPLTENAGGQPGLLLSSECRYLRQGFNAGYVLSRIRLSSGGGRWRDEPDKNDFSHVHDALQYGCLWLQKKGRVSDEIDEEQGFRRAQKARQSTRVQVSKWAGQRAQRRA